MLLCELLHFRPRYICPNCFASRYTVESCDSLSPVYKEENYNSLDLGPEMEKSKEKEKDDDQARNKNSQRAHFHYCLINNPPPHTPENSVQDAQEVDDKEPAVRAGH
jgi:hypothetical protein